MKLDFDAPKRPTNVSLSEALLADAKKLGVNISRAAERGVTRAVAEKRAELWIEENEAALRCSNEYVERHGLPLASF
jgi:antitoxin CcdA